MRALWNLAPTTLVGIPCLVVLLANHRGLGRSETRVSKDGCWFCRLSGLSPYVGGDRAGKRRRSDCSIARRRVRLLPRPSKDEPGKRRRDGAERRDRVPRKRQPRTQCVACLLKWRVPPFNGQKLPIVRMHRSQGVDAFSVLFQL